jgi:carbamate kinase
VDRVWENFGKENARPIARMDVGEARKMLEQGQFPPGSMGPKIIAAIDYINGGGREVLITSAEKLKAALVDRSGTKIVRNRGGAAPSVRGGAAPRSEGTGTSGPSTPLQPSARTGASGPKRSLQGATRKSIKGE